MQEYYHCLVVTPSSHHSLFADILTEFLPIGYEELDNSFIIRSQEPLDDISWAIEQYAKALSEKLDTEISVENSIEKLKNDDWVKVYQQSVEPLCIGKFYIHPPWEDENSELINIVISPALAFGTGHHPTTFTCIEAISQFVEPNMSLCDVGCGSAILAIAAAKLGATVDACDTDIDSIKNTKENTKLNGVELNSLWQGSIANSEKKYDVVVANIVADVLTIISNDLKNSLNQSGILILSGILEKYEAKVLRAYKDCEVVKKIAKDEWITLILKK
ncbi:MAG: 50S ribosomal protein L11 methyltransferase [Campylobacterota bacterium]|nr:50S ribosomal protein L11 methyltransferase [Campylobacterota bacterium]